MSKLNFKEIPVSMLEMLIVNFAFPSDLVYHTLKSAIVEDKYSSQSFGDRVRGIWNGKISKYQKVLAIKRDRGYIPERIRDLCRKTPCGSVRLALSYTRNF